MIVKGVASLLLSTVLVLVTTPANAVATATRLVSPAIFAKVLRVHHCEEPTWHVRGPFYQGGLGFRLATWSFFRLPTFPVSMADATPQQQAWALSRLINFYHMAWPDQHGCHGGY